MTKATAKGMNQLRRMPAAVAEARGGKSSAPRASRGASTSTEMKRMAAMLPTNANNSGQRVVTTSASRILVVVLKPTSGRNTPSAISAVSPVSRSAPAKRVRILAPPGCMPPMSDLLDVGPAQQPLGQENQGDCQYGESGDILVVDREVSRPQRFNQSDQKTADDCARERADSAEHRRREGLHAGDKAVGK